MRAGLILLCLSGCTAHIDLKFRLQADTGCSDAALAGNPAAPMTCDQLTLGCADHLLLRVRKDDGGDIINSRCVSLDAAGNPADLCAMERLKDPVSLIDSVPSGTRFYFQLAALHYNTGTTSCDDENSPPLRVFSGKSDSVLIDGNDHVLTLMLTSCGSCSNLPGQQASDLGAIFHDLGAPVSDLGIPSDGAMVFPDLAGSDLASGDMAQTICIDRSFMGGGVCCQEYSETCPAPQTPCAGGGVALLPPGGCCAVCD